LFGRQSVYTHIPWGSASPLLHFISLFYATARITNDDFQFKVYTTQISGIAFTYKSSGSKISLIAIRKENIDYCLCDGVHWSLYFRIVALEFFSQKQYPVAVG